MGLCEALQSAHSSMCLGLLWYSSPSQEYVLTKLLLLKIQGVSQILVLNGFLGTVNHTGFCIQDWICDLISLEVAY